VIVLASTARSGHYALVAQGDLESVAPSGWYPDSDPAQQRWWDGQKWSSLTRPDPGPPNLRRRRLLHTGVALLTAGVVLSMIPYPWVAGDPTAGHPKEPVPTWANVVGVTGWVAIALGIVAFVSHWVVRRRRQS
jgi:hypothetical protein